MYLYGHHQHLAKSLRVCHIAAFLRVALHERCGISLNTDNWNLCSSAYSDQRKLFINGQHSCYYPNYSRPSTSMTPYQSLECVSLGFSWCTDNIGYTSETHLKYKSSSCIASISVAKSFRDFAQSTAVILPCSVHKIKTICWVMLLS